MKYLLLLCLSWFLLWPVQVMAQTTESEPTLAELEQAAAKRMEEGHPENALEIYHYFERMMFMEKWDRLQKDVLHNKVVASYRAGKLAETMAYAKQLYILEPSSERSELIREIEMLIEHKVYHAYPNTTFLRGQASDYALWESCHRYSRAELRVVFLFSWSVLFFLIIAAYLFRKHKKVQVFLLCCIAMSFVFTVIMAGFNILHSTTSHTRFGVIENSFNLHVEADYDSKTVAPTEFIPGMTVEIVANIPGWVKVMRIDGETAWIGAEDLYILRGKGDNHPAHFVPPKNRKSPI